MDNNQKYKYNKFFKTNQSIKYNKFFKTNKMKNIANSKAETEYACNNLSIYNLFIIYLFITITKTKHC